MVANIDKVIQNIAVEAYKKTAPRRMSEAEVSDGNAFKREYAGALVRDYFYTTHQDSRLSEKQQHLQKLKASIESLQLPEDFVISQLPEELSLSGFVKMLEKEISSFEERKTEKLEKEQENLKGLSQDEMENIVLKSKEEVTLGDVEKFRHHSMKGLENKELPPEVVAQIKKHFENQGITPTPEHEEIAKRILEKGVELSPVVCSNIDHLITAKNKEISQERIAELKAEYNDISQISLSDWNWQTPLSKSEVEQIVAELKAMEDGYQAKIGTSFRTIEEALANYKSHDAKAEKADVNEKSKSQISFQYIRYKMTLEKALTLNSRGIEINRTELVTIERELLRLEVNQETLGQTARQKGISEEAVLDQMLVVEHGMMDIMAADYGLLNKIGPLQTLQQVTVAAAGQMAAMAAQRYDALGTQVRSDLGDSMNKAIYRLHSLLAANGIEVSDANLRAAAILGRGQAEIHTDNIEKIKEIDQKLQLILRGLTPEVMLELLAQGQDVLAMNFDDLANLADHKESKDFRKLSDRMANKIAYLEKQNKINPQEKESLITFYRLLHTIEKSEGGAASFLMKDNREITLENLYDAAKYLRQQTSINQTIDSQTGLLESESFSDLKSQIRNGFLEKKREMREFLAQVEEEIFQDYDGLDAKSGYQTLKSYSLKDLEALFTAWKVPNMADAEMYKQFQKLPFLWSDSFRKLEKTAEKNERIKEKVDKIKSILSADGTQENAAEAVQAILKELEADFISGVSQEEKTAYAEIAQVKSQWQYRQKLEQNQEFFQIPVWNGNELHQINMYYPKDKQREVRMQGELNVLLAFELPAGHQVSGFLKGNSERGELIIQSESRALRNQIVSHKDQFVQAFAEHQFPLNFLALGSFQNLSPYEDSGNSLKEKIDTELLTPETVVTVEQTEIGMLEKRMIPLAKELAGIFYRLASE